MLKQCVKGFHGTFRCLALKSSILYYSTSVASKDRIPNLLTVEYLVKSVGVSEEEAVSIVTNPKVSHRLNSAEKSQLVVEALKNSGFDGTHIRKVVISIPSVLRINVEKNLKPKLRVFQELGFCGSDLGLLISQNPHVLSRSLEYHIVPALDTLKSLFGSNEQLVRFMLKTKSQRFLGSDVLKYLPDNWLLLRSYGLPREKIKVFIRQRPNFLLHRTQWIEDIVKRVEEKLGIPRTSSMFLHGISAMTRKSEEKMESWLEIFRSYGWNETEISDLLKRHPLALSLSEESLRVRLKYLMGDLGYKSDYLATVPALLSYSMEKRIVPRIAVMRILKDKHLLKRDVSLPTFIYMGESRFLEKFVLPFKKKLPQLYEYYTRVSPKFPILENKKDSKT